MLIYEWDTRRILRVNRAFTQRYGYTEEEADDLTIDDIRPEEDLPEFREALRNVDPAGIHDSGVHRHRTSGGEIFYVKVTSQSMVYEECDARLVSLIDVNESVEAERRARRAYEELNHHVRNSPLALVRLDRELTITEWSPQAVKLSGLSREEVLGRTPFELDILPEEDEGRVRRTLRAMIRGQLDRHQQTLRFYHADGAEIPIRLHTSALRDGEGGLVSVMTQIEDLSRQKRLEHRYQKLFETANDAILILQEGVFVDCNRRAEKLFGCTREEILGATPADFSPRRQPDGKTSEERARDYISEADRSGQTTFAWVHQTAAGQPVPTEVSLNSITFHDEEYVQGIVRDVSERKENEARLRNSLQEKQLLLEEVHHRVKNNLAVISALLEVQILDEVEPRITEVLGNSLKRIKTIALVHEMLYRAEDYTRLPLSGYFDRLVALNREMRSSPREVEIALDVEDIDLNINQAIPCAMLLNELINHYHHTLFAGEEDGRMDIRIYSEGDTVHMEVRATGNGKAGGSPDREEALAMTLVRKLAEQLEGEMELEESEGEGRFSLVFRRGQSRGSASHRKVVE